MSLLISDKSTLHTLPAKIFKDSALTLATLFLLLALVTIGHADTPGSSLYDHISIQKISPDANASGGYGYKLQYHVAAPIDIFWSFKTNFDSDILLSNGELLEHRLVRRIENNVITENRYATAPGLRFLWQTTVIEEKYRLEFTLLNPEDCRHEFHFGVIQLIPAGDYTKITQTAFFNFVGASMWVSYPWYGGMKSTLTKVAKWEQKMALRQRIEYKLPAIDQTEAKNLGILSKEPER